jgi:hypothetical protein
MRKITVIRIKMGSAHPLIRRLAAFKTARNKKAIILIALIVPLIFLVLLLFSHMNA